MAPLLPGEMRMIDGLAMRLTVEGLSAERGGRLVLKDVGLAIDAGKLLLVTGPNGSGKSTLLRVLCGLLPASAGSIRVDGQAGEDGGLATLCHYLGHQNGLKPVLSLRENLDFWCAFHGEGRRSVMEALAAVGLDGLADLQVAYLSTGQRRRAALARLLVNQRPIWLLDEPTAGLDERARRRFAALMADHLAGGGLIVAATHEPLGVAASGELRLAEAN